MAIQSMSVTFRGIDQLLQNNPQTSDPLNHFSKEMKKLTAKRKKQDEDILEMRRLEMRAKLYWDDEVGVYVPSSWVMAMICGNSWTRAKIKKADIRAAVFATSWKLPLDYAGKNKVKQPLDIVDDESFQCVKSLKQGQVRVVKASPVFSNWAFTCDLEYDDTIISKEELQGLIEYGSKFGGFGDFRPTYGRAIPEVEHG
jgi:hypothetical protein